MIGEAKFISFPGLYCRRSSLKLIVFLSNLLVPINLHGFKVYSRTHGHTHMYNFSVHISVSKTLINLPFKEIYLNFIVTVMMATTNV